MAARGRKIRRRRSQGRRREPEDPGEEAKDGVLGWRGHEEPRRVHPAAHRHRAVLLLHLPRLPTTSCSSTTAPPRPPATRARRAAARCGGGRAPHPPSSPPRTPSSSRPAPGAPGGRSRRTRQRPVAAAPPAAPALRGAAARAGARVEVVGVVAVVGRREEVRRVGGAVEEGLDEPGGARRAGGGAGQAVGDDVVGVAAVEGRGEAAVGADQRREEVDRALRRGGGARVAGRLLVVGEGVERDGQVAEVGAAVLGEPPLGVLAGEEARGVRLGGTEREAEALLARRQRQPGERRRLLVRGLGLGAAGERPRQARERRPVDPLEQVRRFGAPVGGEARRGPEPEGGGGEAALERVVLVDAAAPVDHAAEGVDRRHRPAFERGAVGRAVRRPAAASRAAAPRLPTRPAAEWPTGSRAPCSASGGGRSSRRSGESGSRSICVRTRGSCRRA